MKENWLNKTKSLVSESEIPLTDIAEGSGLNYRWLSYLMDGKYADTGIVKIQRLHDFLIGKQGDKEVPNESKTTDTPTNPDQCPPNGKGMAMDETGSHTAAN